MADSSQHREAVEYHVVFVDEPYPRWEVRWGKWRMGYQAWDKRVALSAAKEMAKSDRPSKVIIHDRKTGAAQSGGRDISRRQSDGVHRWQRRPAGRSPRGSHVARAVLTTAVNVRHEGADWHVTDPPFDHRRSPNLPPNLAVYPAVLIG